MSSSRRTEPDLSLPTPLRINPPAPVSAARGDAGCRWKLVVGPRGLNAVLLAAVARMGLAGPVRVLDGGNRFNAYTVARAAGGRREVLERITISRAFTCYQVLSLLQVTQGARPPALPARIPDPGPPNGAATAPLRLVALDLLNTFYDESVRVEERGRLLQACIVQLERLAGEAEGIISVHPPALASEAALDLLVMLEACPALEPIHVEAEAPAPEPPRLF